MINRRFVLDALISNLLTAVCLSAVGACTDNAAQVNMASAGGIAGVGAATTTGTAIATAGATATAPAGATATAPVPAMTGAVIGGVVTQDAIAGPLTQDLAGVALSYKYTMGGSYHIMYGTDTVTFTLPLPTGENSPPITVPYRARKIRDDLYLIHWLSPDRSVHVTQMLDLTLKQVNVAALMPDKIEMFDVGTIEAMTRM